MKYLCLIYENEKNWETMPQSDAEAIMKEYFAFTEDIRKNGKYVAGEALQPTPTATTVRVRNGKISTTDGPFVETKEYLSGFWVIEAPDLDVALKLAADGSRHCNRRVEVRPFLGMSM